MLASANSHVLRSTPLNHTFSYHSTHEKSRFGKKALRSLRSRWSSSTSCLLLPRLRKWIWPSGSLVPAATMVAAPKVAFLSTPFWHGLHDPTPIAVGVSSARLLHRGAIAGVCGCTAAMMLGRIGTSSSAFLFAPSEALARDGSAHSVLLSMSFMPFCGLSCIDFT